MAPTRPSRGGCLAPAAAGASGESEAKRACGGRAPAQGRKTDLSQAPPDDATAGARAPGSSHADAKRADPRVELARALAQGRRVLLAEDDPVIRVLSTEVIRSVTGTPPDVAEDGQAALELMARQRYDLVLLDMQMPVLDGPQTARRIRSLPEGRLLPIVALTANVGAQDVQRCIDAGMDRHMAKPLTEADLRTLLIELFQARTA